MADAGVGQIPSSVTQNEEQNASHSRILHGVVLGWFVDGHSGESNNGDITTLLHDSVTAFTELAHSSVKTAVCSNPNFLQCQKSLAKSQKEVTSFFVHHFQTR